MIVFDLQCHDGGHVFEGWFSSSENYEHRRARGLVLCPVCGAGNIGKAVMAPAVSAKSNQIKEKASPTVASAPAASSLPVSAGLDSEKAQKLMQALVQAQAEALANSEWVGRTFADRARAMHYGEETSAPIHGEVAPEEARNLVEEGVEVAPLLFPVIPPEVQN
jgi:hypothetical protein